jgi:hypothetical protein
MAAGSMRHTAFLASGFVSRFALREVHRFVDRISGFSFMSALYEHMKGVFSMAFAHAAYDGVFTAHAWACALGAPLKRD